VTLHTPCHALRALHVRDQPIALLRSVRGLRFIDLPRDDECCGFGGTFAVKNADVSVAMLADKIESIRETKAEVCAATDNSCLMHIGGGLHRQQTGIRCMQVAEILATTEEAPAEQAPAAMPRGLPRGISESSRRRGGVANAAAALVCPWGPGASAKG